MAIPLKTSEEIVAMRVGGKILAHILADLVQRVKAGMTAIELAAAAKRQIKAAEAEAAFLGYNGFPDVICVSINNEVVHGVPGQRQIKEGDLVSLDLGIRYKGLITDGALTVAVEPVSADDRRLLEATEQALAAGIAAIEPGAHLGDISTAIQAVLDKAGLGIVRQLCGHGVGRQMHEEPSILNFGRAGTGPELKPGMTLAIEPMATLGDDQVKFAKDGTAITADGSRAAHFEHTVLITKTGHEILTTTD